MAKKTITLIYFDAGGGHRAAARALQAVIAQQRRPWQVQLLNLSEVLDPQASFRKLTGVAPEELYNKRLARGWTLGLAQELKLLQGLIRLGHTAMLRPLQQHWLRTEPDLVVSLIPNFNRVMCESLASALPGVPYVTVLTDMADHPPHFWIEPEPQPHRHVVCGTPQAVQQARAMGYVDAQIHFTSGMPMHPDFYRPAAGDRAALRHEHGLPADRPTGVVMFGGQGSQVMKRIAAQLPDIPLVLLCGHNTALADELRAMRSKAPRVVVGFTTEVRCYMEMGDFFIGKPGPGCLSEAVHCGLPVVTVRNAWTMPQERFNTDWVREQGVGVVHDSFRRIRPAVLALIEHLDAYRQAVRRIDNRAVFELPEILESILAAAARPASAWPGVTVTERVAT